MHDEMNSLNKNRTCVLANKPTFQAHTSTFTQNNQRTNLQEESS